MQFLFSASGRLAPSPFLFGALAVYVAGAASQFLTNPALTGRAGLWLFAAAQALLIWIWYALHAKRLNDAGLRPSIAACGALVYALSVVLLVMLAASFVTPSDLGAVDPNASSALGVLTMVAAVAALLGASQHDLTALTIAVITALAFVPIIIAVLVTIWAATRPSLEDRRA